MGLVPGLRARQVNAVCCGIGTYGLKAEKYDIAMEVGRSLFEQVRASRCRAVGVRLGDLPLADRGGHGSPLGAPGGDPPPGLWPRLVPRVGNCMRTSDPGHR